MTHPRYIQRKAIVHRARAVLNKFGLTGTRPASVLPEAPASIPRILWLHWEQGYDEAPELVRECRRTWEELNPGWDIRVIDRVSGAAAADLPPLPDTILSAHRADVLRTRLLAEHGGVWADATTWCLRPLDEWLPMAGHAGFFIFTWDGADRQIIARSWPRLIGNWFIAAAPGNPLIRRWDDLTTRYWEGRRSTEHYFWHNDALEYAVSHDPASKRVWDRMPKYSAGPPHFAWLALEHGEDMQRAQEGIRSGAVPLQKLSWRMKLPLEELRSFLAG